MRKRYILFLIIVLMIIWGLSDLRRFRVSIFEKAQEYSFEEKTLEEIDQKVNKEAIRYSKADTAEAQILSLVNMLECRYYLLYKNQFSLKKYYDLIKVILYPELRYQIKNKKKYVDETGKFLRRKRKLRLQYIKYEVSKPVFSKSDSHESAEVFLIRTSQGDKEYIKYDLRKHTNNRYYLYLQNTISLNQPKFRFNVSAKQDNNE